MAAVFSSPSSSPTWTSSPNPATGAFCAPLKRPSEPVPFTPPNRFWGAPSPIRKPADPVSPAVPRALPPDPFPDRVSARFPAVGLINIGNTCFMNAVLQCLLRVRPLSELLASSQFPGLINHRNPRGSHGRIAVAFRSLLHDLGTAARPINPAELHRAVNSVYARFNNHEQHDAHEFLVSLLDGLHEDLNQAPGARGETRPGSLVSPNDIFLFNNKSDIIDIFHGQSKSHLAFPSCRHGESILEQFATWEVALCSKLFHQGVTLEDCLKEYAKEEKLSRDNKAVCSMCNEKKDATRKTTVVSVGKTLVIHLKRFSGYGSNISKNNKPVTYPSVLNLGSFTESEAGEYRLTGVVLHLGSLHGGHYLAVARDPFSGRWYQFDDSRVREVTEKEAHQPAAYVLFYQAP
jgi:ubiquitin C-terminal hydrolase